MVRPSRSLPVRHASALLTSAMVSAAHAKSHAHAEDAGRGGGTASGGGRDLSRARISTSRARMSALIRSVWVSNPATQTDRISADMRALLVEMRALLKSLPPPEAVPPPRPASSAWAWLFACAAL